MQLEFETRASPFAHARPLVDEAGAVEFPGVFLPQLAMNKPGRARKMAIEGIGIRIVRFRPTLKAIDANGIEVIAPSVSLCIS